MCWCIFIESIKHIRIIFSYLNWYYRQEIDCSIKGMLRKIICRAYKGQHPTQSSVHLFFYWMLIWSLNLMTIKHFSKFRGLFSTLQRLHFRNIEKILTNKSRSVLFCSKCYTDSNENVCQLNRHRHLRHL